MAGATRSGLWWVSVFEVTQVSQIYPPIFATQGSTSW